MILGAVTYNVLKDWDLETIVTKLEELGYGAVELRTTHAHGVEPSIGKSERERVRKRFEKSSVRLAGYGSTCEFHSPDAEERKRQVQIGRSFVDLARDTGAVGVKVRPNGLPEGVSQEKTVAGIASSLRELGDYAGERGIEIWVECHGAGTMHPNVMANIMKATSHPSVWICWNSNGVDVNGVDVVDGTIKPSFEMLKGWIRSVHINELANDYPWRELFTLLRESGYDRWTLCEAQESPQPERFLKYYRALWTAFGGAVTSSLPRVTVPPVR